MTNREILQKLPYSKPFLFVDELIAIDENGVEGSFTFDRNSDFYTGHFKDHPVTPGVLLTECCAQIGLVCLGVFLLDVEGVKTGEEIQIGLSSSEMEFYEPVFPSEKVVVKSTKVYFRFNKLKCEVKMYNAKGKLVCKGMISGMLKLKQDG